MQINKGVEWAVHACALLAPLPAGRGLSLASLATFHGVPLPYMAKQMQLLSKAGIVKTSRGKSGGYALARAAPEISLWDIKQAIEGTRPAFRCTEIRQRGPCAVPRTDCLKACPIAAAFAKAERAFQDALASVSLSEILVLTGEQSTPEHMGEIMGWYGPNITILPGAS